MLSGQLAPSSANFQYFLEEDSTIPDVHYKNEKLRIPNLSSTSATAYATAILPTETTSTATTTTAPPIILQNGSATLPFPGLLSSASGQLAFAAGTSSTPTELPNRAETTAATTAISTNSAAEASGRSAALERAYVHDVYENCDEPVGPIRPRVAQFLAGLDPGSIVCDVGCGNGRYLTACNPLICTIGVDRCYRLTKVAREKKGEVAICDNLELPFRDESFDAVLSLAVVHHFATTERRVGAIRELARILRIGGRVIISVWALEQRHRRFESQDVLIPWQPPKNRNFNYSDEEDDDEYLPPYHAYTEDSTNSSRSAGDGDSSSLSSSSPGESCYSFVRRAIQKLAGGRKHPWFLDSWNSKDTKNDSSLEYEDAKDLPIELRRLEDFEDFPDPPLSAGLKSRSLGSILNPPPRQIVRSRSSVPSLGAQIPEPKPPPLQSTLASLGSASSSHQQQSTYVMASTSMHNSTTSISTVFVHQDSNPSDRSSPLHSAASITSLSGRRPKLMKQKQSLCDDDYQLPDNPSANGSSGNLSSGSAENHKISGNHFHKNGSKILLRKQSSLNEELMAENRLREKDRVRKRIQKQMSLNEAFLCRSVFTKRLQVIREGFTTKLKTSTGSLERVTKNSFVKIMQNIKNSQFSTKDHSHDHNHHHQHHQHQNSAGIHQVRSNSITSTTGCAGRCGTGNAVSGAASATVATANCSNSSNCNNSNNNNGSEDQTSRRHSRESGSDSSKDSSLQSDTSIESEDSFASVIFIPKPELGNHQQQCTQNSYSCNNDSNSVNCKNNSNSHKIPSVPTSPLIMPCPPTPAHSPAAATSSTSIPSSSTTTCCSSTIQPTNTAVASALSANVPTIPKLPSSNLLQGNEKKTISSSSSTATNRFIFDEDHIQLQQQQQQQWLASSSDAVTKSRQKLPKITRQIIKDLPQIPKFRKQQSLQQQPNKSAYPIVRRSSAAPTVPKLMSLEIYNPETDDLDSDSSEPSSPDSIDSVISALKPGPVEEQVSQQIPQPQLHQQELQKHQQEQIQLQELILKSNQAEITNLSRIGNVENQLSDLFNIKDTLLNNATTSTDDDLCRQHLVDFAEKLSAQLLKELDESNKLDNCGVPLLNNADEEMAITNDDGSHDGSSDNIITDRFNIYQKHKQIDDPFLKKVNGEMRDITSIREELRERRLMLANLTRSPSPINTIGCSSTSSSASSLSLKSQSGKLKGSGSYRDLYDDTHNRKLKFIRSFGGNDRLNNQQQQQHQFNTIGDTTYLISKDDDDDENSFCSSNDYDDGDGEIEHDVIIEEDEDQEDDDEEVVRHIVVSNNDGGDDGDDNGEVGEDAKNNNNNDTSSHSPIELPLDGRPSTESWPRSNSTTSLDSPSQSGGSTTHHRYYHVFREGELDALINHHVASLHIVSSYYERASWCVVAEKVQVWTI